MATHVIELAIRRYYRVYVDDETNSMTNDQLVEKAKEMAIDSDDNMELDMEMDVEESDIEEAFYEYELDD